MHVQRAVWQQKQREACQHLCTGCSRGHAQLHHAAEPLPLGQRRSVEHVGSAALQSLAVLLADLQRLWAGVKSSDCRHAPGAVDGKQHGNRSAAGCQQVRASAMPLPKRRRSPPCGTRPCAAPAPSSAASSPPLWGAAPRPRRRCPPRPSCPSAWAAAGGGGGRGEGAAAVRCQRMQASGSNGCTSVPSNDAQVHAAAKQAQPLWPRPHLFWNSGGSGISGSGTWGGSGTAGGAASK